jgi:hypothetical protein
VRLISEAFGLGDVAWEGGEQEGSEALGTSAGCSAQRGRWCSAWDARVPWSADEAVTVGVVVWGNHAEQGGMRGSLYRASLERTDGKA